MAYGSQDPKFRKTDRCDRTAALQKSLIDQQLPSLRISPRSAAIFRLSFQGFVMSTTFASAVEPFIDRRNYSQPPGTAPRERRQFTNSHEELSPDARELAQAIDSYKLMHRRRFITYEEMLAVVKSLGYHRD